MSQFAKISDNFDKQIKIIDDAEKKHQILNDKISCEKNAQMLLLKSKFHLLEKQDCKKFKYEADKKQRKFEFQLNEHIRKSSFDSKINDLNKESKIIGEVIRIEQFNQFKKQHQNKIESLRKNEFERIRLEKQMKQLEKARNNILNDTYEEEGTVSDEEEGEFDDEEINEEMVSEDNTKETYFYLKKHCPNIYESLQETLDSDSDDSHIKKEYVFDAFTTDFKLPSNEVEKFAITSKKKKKQNSSTNTGGNTFNSLRYEDHFRRGDPKWNNITRNVNSDFFNM